MLALALPGAISVCCAAVSGKLPVAPKWHRFEQSFRSTVAYPNPLQDVRLSVVFTSPLGEEFRVHGFWDGGRTWRIRFAPDQPGEWRFKTSCSPPDKGLDEQAGAFLCTAALGQSPFEQHGPVRLARDQRHFQHADGTPFFWLADTVWNSALVSEPKEWDTYSQIRASQRFTVAQWAVGPGEDFKHESPITGFPDQVGVNPEVFRRLDAKVETLSQVGLLSAIAPLLELHTNAVPLKEDQAALLLEYAVARWGGDPVVWLLAFDGKADGMANRWKDIGHASFREGWHAPVIVFANDHASPLRQFASESWVGGFVAPAANDSAPSLGDQAVLLETREPPRPILACTPAENAPVPGAQKRYSADDVRQAAYSGLLMATPAGVSYAGHGVADWDRATEPNAPRTPGADLPLWHRALFMPAAKQMGRLEKFFTGIDFWRLRPEPKAVVNPPGSAARHISAAGTEAKDLLLVYVPEERRVEISLDYMPASPTVIWLNPRTGATSPAVAVVTGHACQFPTPEPGDWLLAISAGK